MVNNQDIKIMIKQITDVELPDGDHLVSVTTEQNNVATEKYYWDCDKERAYESAQQRALDMDD